MYKRRVKGRKCQRKLERDENLVKQALVITWPTYCCVPVKRKLYLAVSSSHIYIIFLSQQFDIPTLGLSSFLADWIRSFGDFSSSSLLLAPLTLVMIKNDANDDFLSVGSRIMFVMIKNDANNDFLSVGLTYQTMTLEVSTAPFPLGSSILDKKSIRF